MVGRTLWGAGQARCDGTAAAVRRAPRTPGEGDLVNTDKKLVYVLNHVHEKDVSHFYHVMALLLALRTRGWDVTLLSEKGGRGIRTVAGQDVHYLSLSNPVVRLVNLVACLTSLRRQGYRRVFVRISKPAAITAGLLRGLLGFKVFFWQSGTTQDFDDLKPAAQRLAESLTMMALKASIDYFVTGPETMVAYYRDIVGIPQAKLRLLYNDVDLSRFKPANRSEKQGGPLQILLVHRFSPVRLTGRYMPAINDRLTRAAKAGHPIRLVLIGEGPERAELEQQLATARPLIDVQFLGALPNAEIMDHYARSDIFIMPSYREGFPRVIIEAMAAGLPIVTTDAGGSADLLGPLQQAMIASIDDPEGFGDRLAMLLDDPCLRETLAQESRERVRRYSTEVVAEMFEALLLSPDAR